jgi:rod shape-determining protein MreB and related proteins
VRRDLAIDLGTATTRVWRRGEGVVIREPTVVAIEERTGAVAAMGAEAYDHIGRAPGSLVAELPLQGGAIRHLGSVAQLLTLLLARAGVTRLSRAHIVVCVPSGLTSVEQRAVEAAIVRAGASSVSLIAGSLAAAVGAGLPVDEPTGNVIIDVGAGTSEAAVISLGGAVAVTSVRVGGLDMDAAIRRHLRAAHEMAIGERTAEQLKRTIGSATRQTEQQKAVVRRRALASGVAREVVVDAEEVRSAIEREVAAIVKVLLDTLADCPPDLAQDISGAGAVLCGGGALLRGLDARLSHEARIDIAVPPQPLDTVVTGAGAALDRDDPLVELLVDGRR